MTTRSETAHSRSHRLIATIVVAAAIVLAFSSTAVAHDPIFITADQTTPDTGPFMPDGSISWALYGSVLAPGDTRGFEFDLREGDEVFVSLLIPNLSPEVDLDDDELPIIELEGPDGATTTIAPEVREVFDEPFSNTSYVTLAEYRQPAVAGRYRGLIVGSAPSRFSVAIGETEIFFTETERSGDRPSTFADITGPLIEWYTTPPGGEADPDALADGEGEIQLDLIEDAMESGEADAPEASLGGDADAETLDADDEAAADDADDAADEPAEAAFAEIDGTVERASEPDGGGGGSSTWVAPVVIAVIAAVGAGGFLFRRNRTS